MHATLERARTLGFLGPGDLSVHLRQSQALAEHLAPPVRFLDLGTGGGVPGLLLLNRWAQAHAVLLDAGRRRCEFVREAIDELGMADRAGVAEGRAERLARDPALRGQFDLVVARGFAAPAVTAECATGYLRRGGRLVVTAPPEPEPGRWDTDRLRELGFDEPEEVRVKGFGFSTMRMATDPQDTWPRAAPSKRPLWGRGSHRT